MIVTLAAAISTGPACLGGAFWAPVAAAIKNIACINMFKTKPLFYQKRQDIISDNRTGIVQKYGKAFAKFNAVPNCDKQLVGHQPIMPVAWTYALC